MLIVPIRSFYFTTEYLSQNVSELCVEQMENVKRINKLWSADGLFLREYLLVPAPTGDDDGDDDDDSDDDERTLAPSGESLRVSTPENCVFACPCFFYPPYRSISHAARRGVAQVPSSSVRRLSSLFDERVTVGANELFPWLFF